MINPYTEPEVIIAQLKGEYAVDRLIDWDKVLDTGRYYDGFIAYYVSFDDAWLITNYWTGVVEHMCFGRKLEDKNNWSC